MAFCPNCSAELRPSDQDCWNCHASFGSGSTWQPVPVASSDFRPFPQPTPRDPAVGPAQETTVTKVVNGIGCAIAALIIGLPILLVLLLLALNPCLICK